MERRRRNAYKECGRGQRKSWQHAEVTDGWVCDGEQGWPQANTLPTLIFLLIRDPCAASSLQGQKAWCQRRRRCHPSLRLPRLTCPMCGRHHRDLCRRVWQARRRRAAGASVGVSLRPLFVCFAFCGQSLPFRHLERQESLLVSNSLARPTAAGCVMCIIGVCTAACFACKHNLPAFAATPHISAVITRWHVHAHHDAFDTSSRTERDVGIRDRRLPDC